MGRAPFLKRHYNIGIIVQTIYKYRLVIIYTFDHSVYHLFNFFKVVKLQELSMFTEPLMFEYLKTLFSASG